MKNFRRLKKSQISKDDDPEKVAEEKLAFFSDQPFIINNQNSQRWVSESQGKILQDQSQQNKIIKPNKDFRQISKINFKRKFLLMKEESAPNMDLKKYCRIYCNQQNIQSFKLFPQKKSLSLTSYLLFDKRKENPSKQKVISSKHEAKKIELLRLKKLLVSKHQKKLTFSEEKIIQKVESNPSYYAKNKFNNCSLSQTKKISFEQSPKSSRNRESTQSFLQVSRVLSSIIKRKQISNLSVERYHQSYSTAKKKLQDSKFIESSMSLNKIKLHKHFEKFVF